MKYLLVLASLTAVAMAQRPTYAGLSSKGYPELASRFRDPADNRNDNTVGIGNRIGADDEKLPQNLPTDARGDVILVNRLNQWPRENQPFWLVNAQHIERHRHPNENGNEQQQNLNTVQQGSQQRLNEIQPNLSGNQQAVNREQQTVGINQQPVLGGINQPPVLGVQPSGQVLPRFGESVIATEVRTIKPLLRQRGSFAGERN